MITKVVLSAGHSPLRPGARCGELKEHELNMRALRALRGALETFGVTVATLDPLLSLNERVALVKESYGDYLAIELHHNSFNGRAQGAEVFYRAGDKRAFDIGSRALRVSCETTGLVNRGMKLAAMSARGSLGWLRVPQGLLWEVCFMDNPEDIAKVTSDSYENWALSVAKSITCQPLVEP